MKIKISNLTHKYKNQVVINELSINLENASSIGIIGASGCGKSTLMRLLAGIENQTFGEIFINDLSPQNDKKIFQSKIGYVFQKHNLFPHLTIFENLMLIMEKIKKNSEKDALLRVNELLVQFKIENEAHKKPSEISGGQAQRASIARAILTKPEVIFLDEPTASLDPILTKEVLNSVKELKKSGNEFVFITHEMDFLKEFADYVIFMEKGKIIECGDIEILNNPKTEKLKQFLTM